MTELVPAFEVEKYDGSIIRRTYKYEVEYLRDDEGDIVVDDNGRKVIKSKQRVMHEEEQEGGWMVYFPSGSSMHVPTEAEMIRLGFMQDPQFVDEDGEVVPVSSSYKARAQQRAARPRGRGRAANA